jgi:23S rRNA (uracil1939-C5)-methyltransferase
VDDAGLAERVEVVTALVESALASALPADVVVLNPPRAGVAVGVTALLEQAASRGVRGIVYVSCDPATLARDLARVPGWRIDAVRCFDMFPQTAHVETVCVLRPETTT